MSIAVDGIPAGRGLAQARWTIKRGFQLGLVDGMTGAGLDGPRSVCT